MTLRDPLSAADDAPARTEIPIPPSVLRGPADADHYRVQVGNTKHRWYVDPLPADDKWPEDAEDKYYPAVSTVKKASGSDWTKVGLRRVAKATTGLRGRFDDLNEDEIYKIMDTDNWAGLDKASLRGTNVHYYFEMGLRGHPITYRRGPWEEGAEYLPAVRQFFFAYEPKLLVAEYVTLHRDLNDVGYGGTGDAIVEMNDKNGNRIIAAVDWKSRKDEGRQTAYAEEAAQVAANARAQYMIVEGPDGVPRREDVPHCDMGVIVSIRPDGPRVYPIDLDKAFEHFTALHAWWKARKTERDSINRVWPPPRRPDLMEELQMTTSREEAIILWKLNKGKWTDEHTAAMKEKWPSR